MLIDARDELTPREYELFRELIYRECGINLGPQKQPLVRARLGKRLRAGRFPSYRAYYEYIRSDRSGAELTALIDAISTNTTHLFREPQHFEFVAATVHAWARDQAWRSRHDELRCWSAGCSTGEEPYSLAMTLDDALAAERLPFRILATDLSTRVLAQAALGQYEARRLDTVPARFRQRYFGRSTGGPSDVRAVLPELRRRITFRQLNLMAGAFPFRRGFHLILCRNVMIYFDRATQEALVGRLAAHLLAGGYLLIGHSESLNSIRHALKYVRPTVYQKHGA